MSGHSHWANIKYKKGREDKKRGKIFSRASRQITQAVREGGGDPEFNLVLKAAIEEAKMANMPKEGIKKAIEAGVGKSSSGAQEILEGYGPGGVAFLVRVETDNKNRTLSEVRRIFVSFGGSLAEAGSSAYIFEGGRPKFEIGLSGDGRGKVTKMVDSLKECPDVIEVLTNAKFL